MSGLSSFNCEISSQGAVDQTLVCPICQELMNQPVSMPCGHSACKTCLEEMLSKSVRGKACPLCRETINPGKLNINLAVRALISRIGVRCINVGCTWNGEHRDMKDHSDTCQLMVLQCPNGCSESHTRERLDHHLAACPYQKMPCRFCKVGVPRFNLDTHVENCPEGPQLCPLQCGEQMPRSHIHLHLGDCPKRMVKCAVKGCHNYYPLGAERDHDQQYQESHQVLLKNEVERLGRLLFNKADGKVERKLKTRKSFRWTLKLSDIEDGKDVASPFFNLERSLFRCIWRRTSIPPKMALEQVMSSKPLTVRARFALLRDGDVCKAFETRYPETISEGKTISTEVDFGNLGNDQELEIKVIIAIYSYT